MLQSSPLLLLDALRFDRRHLLFRMQRSEVLVPMTYAPRITPAVCRDVKRRPKQIIAQMSDRGGAQYGKRFLLFAREDACECLLSDVASPLLVTQPCIEQPHQCRVLLTKQ